MREIFLTLPTLTLTEGKETLINSKFSLGEWEFPFQVVRTFRSEQKFVKRALKSG